MNSRHRSRELFSATVVLTSCAMLIITMNTAIIIPDSSHVTLQARCIAKLNASVQKDVLHKKRRGGRVRQEETDGAFFAMPH